jgi:peptidoglycan/xylan/chitin deacetylase (PgdA/CDA1 family)
MPKKTDSTVVTLLLLLLAVAAFGLVVFRQPNQQRAKVALSDWETEELYYQKTVTEEDRKPLPVPQTAINKGSAVKVPILMYHHVGQWPPSATPLRKDLTVSAADFQQQVKWLAENNYTSILLKDILLYSQGKFIMPKKPVIFTFDDGYEDVFINAIPILKKYGFRGSFGVITQYPHTQNGDNYYASWAEIAKAFQDGNEIVSHTQNHFDGKNSKFSQDYIFQNLTGSIQDIKEHLGLATKVLIYPYGHYTPAYIQQAKKAGFVMGITVHEGNVINLDNLMEVSRVRVHGNEPLEKFQRLVSE